MIVTQKKDEKEVISALKGAKRVFLVGCGDCATACNTGSEEALLAWEAVLNNAGFSVSGKAIPEIGCNAASIKKALSKATASLKDADVILVFSCGLGTQTVKENLRFDLKVLPGCDSLFAGAQAGDNVVNKKCVLCGSCVLASTETLCPKALCPKGMLNGPCGGMNKGKCEIDSNKDCVWVLIHKQAKDKNKLLLISPAQDFSKHNIYERINLGQK